MADDTEDKPTERFAILTTDISPERLAALKIRILDQITIFDDLPCFVIGKSGVKKLTDYSYVTDKTSAVTGMEGMTFVALMNPDRSRARADIDPKTIRLVEFVNKVPTKGDAAKTQRRLLEFFRDRLGGVVDKSLRIVFGNFAVTQRPTDASRFHVILCGSPNAGTLRYPATLWGKPAGGATGEKQQFGFGPDYDGTPLYAPEGEFGSYTDNTLLLYGNPIQAGTDADFDVLEQMIQVFERTRTHGAGVDRDVIRQTYIDTCMQRAEAEEKTIRGELKELTDQLREAQDTVIRATRDMQVANVKLNAITGDATFLKEKLGKEFEALCKHDRVKNVFWRGNRLVVETKTLHFTDPRSNKEHELGEMRIVLETEPFEVRFNNVTRKVRAFRGENMNGPHLFPDGRACLGNMNNIIPKLVADYRFKDAVTQAIAFCESVNVDDGAGAMCNLWPLSERQKQLDAAGKA